MQVAATVAKFATNASGATCWPKFATYTRIVKEVTIVKEVIIVTEVKIVKELN